MKKKNTIDKVLTVYQNIWLLFIEVTLIIGCVALLAILRREIPLFIPVAIIVFIITRRVMIKKYSRINKKIRAYEEITKKEYEFWRKRYTGLATYEGYEDYLQVCNLPPEKRDLFKDVTFDSIFKKIPPKKYFFNKFWGFFRYEDDSVI